LTLKLQRPSGLDAISRLSVESLNVSSQYLFNESPATFDFSWLRKKKLKELTLAAVALENLEALADTEIGALYLHDVRNLDLNRAANTSVRKLTMRSAPKTLDLTPLRKWRIEELHLPFSYGLNMEPLRGHPTLKTIDGKAVEKYWVEHDQAKAKEK
jgi:hypothetical protein